MNKQCPLCKHKITRKQSHVFQDGKRVHKSCYDQLDISDKDFQATGILPPRRRFYTKAEMDKKRKKVLKTQLP